MIEAVVIDRLNEIVALGERVYINDIPQEEQTPFASVFFISNNPSQVKDSVSPLDRVRVQVSVFARTYLEATTINGEVRSKLDNYIKSITDSEADDYGQEYRFTFENSYGEYDQQAELQSAISDYICAHNRNV